MNTEDDSFVLLSAITPGSGKKRDVNSKPKYVKLTLKKNLEILIDTNLRKEISDQLDTSSSSESGNENQKPNVSQLVEVINISSDDSTILISSDEDSNDFQDASDRMSHLFPKLSNDSLISEDLSEEQVNISNDSNMSSDNIPMSNISDNPTQTLDSYTLAQIRKNIESANDSSAELVNLKSDGSSDGNISRRESDILDAFKLENSSSESPTDWVDVAPKFAFKPRTVSESSNFEEIVHDIKMDEYNRCKRNVSPEGGSPITPQEGTVGDRLISAIMRATAEKSSSESPPSMTKPVKPPRRTKKVRKVLVCNMFDVSDMSYEEEVEVSDEGTPEIMLDEVIAPESEEMVSQPHQPHPRISIPESTTSSVLVPETQSSLPIKPKLDVIINDSQEYRYPDNVSLLSSDRSNSSLISSDASIPIKSKLDFTDVADRFKRMSLAIPETDSESESGAINPPCQKTIDESIIESSSDEELYKTAAFNAAVEYCTNPPKVPTKERKIVTEVSTSPNSSVSMIEYPDSGEKYKITQTSSHIHVESVRTPDKVVRDKTIEIFEKMKKKVDIPVPITPVPIKPLEKIDEQTTPRTMNKDAEALLDQLYGKGWRESARRLPVTEPVKPCDPAMVLPEPRSKLNTSGASSINFSLFSQKINQDMDSTRNPKPHKTRDSFVVSDGSEDNNSPTFHTSILNSKKKIFPKPTTTPRIKPEKTPILKKLTELCDPETSDSDASIQMEKLQISETPIRSFSQTPKVQLQHTEPSMEKLALSEDPIVDVLEDAMKEFASPEPFLEVVPDSDPFKLPSKTPGKTRRRRLFCQKDFEDDNSAVENIEIEINLPNLTYTSTGAEETDRELTYVDRVLLETEKKRERDRLRILKQREKTPASKLKTPVSKSKTPAPKSGRKKKGDDEYIPPSLKRCTKKKISEEESPPDFDTDDDDILVSATPKPGPSRRLNKFKSKLTPTNTPKRVVILSSDESNDESDVESLPESLGSDSEDDEEVKAKDRIRQSISGLSFLASLSTDVPLTRAHPEAVKYKQNFKKFKEELAEHLFKLYNETIFENKIPSNTTLEWSARMRGTAGYCYNKRIVHALGNEERFVRIVLSTKVIDQPSRVRDTLIHEMCHAATWIIDKINDGHGSIWKSWARKAIRRFPELPPIKRCHDYEIGTKYTYKCTSCGYSFGRQSKSLDLEKKRCGYCWGSFEVLLNKKAKDGTVKAVQTPKKVTGFAKYMQDNFKSFKEEMAGENLKHCELMRLLGQRYKELKNNNAIEDE